MDNTIFHIAVQLLGEKLQFVTIKPKKIAILGSDYASSTGLLGTMYSAKLTEIDIDKKRHPANQAHSWMNGLFKKRCKFQLVDFLKLPFSSQHQYDFIISNLYLARMGNHKEQIIDTYKSLLKFDGLLFFSFLGLDSFREIYALFKRTIYQDLPSYQMDMHDIGDELIRVGFAEPVMSMDLLVLTYSKVETLLQDLIALGILPSMLSWLNISYQDFEKNLRHNIETTEIKFKVSYEFIFAHAVYKNQTNKASKIEQEIKFYQLYD